MNLRLEEIGTTPNSTGSHLFIDNRPFCFTVEDGYRDKKIKHETRIPAGRYRVVPRTVGSFFEKYKKQFGHKFVLHLLDVPGFEYILLHIGNTVKDTSGCVLVNRFLGLGTDGNYTGTDSTSVYKLMYSLAEKALERGEEIWIEIQRRKIVDATNPYA